MLGGRSVTVTLINGESKIYIRKNTINPEYTIWVKYVVISIGLYLIAKHSSPSI